MREIVSEEAMGPKRAFPARWEEVWSKRALKARDLTLVRPVPTAAGIKERRDACSVVGSASRSLPSVLRVTPFYQ